MPINILNNENKKNIKDSLVILLDQLKVHRRITAYLQPVNRDGLEPHVYVAGLNKAINILINLNADFESVDDFDSIKKLREAELFFLKTNGLKEFKFPDYKRLINPKLLTYAEIEIQLDVLSKKSEDLLHRNRNLTAWEAKYLICDFRDLNRWYFEEEKINYDEYKSRALTIINETRTVLEPHLGFKEILGNLLLLISTLGTAFIVNKAVNGHFFFFQKNYGAKQLDTISKALAATNQLSP